MSQNALVTADEIYKKFMAQINKGIEAPGGRRINVAPNRGLFVMPDGRNSRGPMDVVVVGFRNNNVRYVNPFKTGAQPGEQEPPQCWAWSDTDDPAFNDDLVPDPEGEVQAENCRTCKWNQWGSDPSDSAKKRKGCNNITWIAVASPGAPEEGVYTMKLAVTCNVPWKVYVSQLKSQQLSPMHVITRLSFNPSGLKPPILFQNVGTHEIAEHIPSLYPSGQELLTALSERR